MDTTLIIDTFTYPLPTMSNTNPKRIFKFNILMGLYLNGQSWIFSFSNLNFSSIVTKFGYVALK